MLRRVSWLVPAAVILAGSLPAASPGLAGGAQPREVVATCKKIDGALLRHTKDGFKAVKVGDKIAPQTLLVGLPRAELITSDGLVSIDLMLYIGDAMPVTEAAVVFHDDPKFSADINVDRGVISVQNLNPKGDAVVKIRGGDQVWELTLQGTDTEILVARFGRHEPGTKWFKGGAKKPVHDDPLMHFGVLVVKGKVKATTNTHTYALNAPPGPALLSWDRATGDQVERMEKLPDELKKLEPADEKIRKEAVAIIGQLTSGDLGKGLDQLVGSDSLLKRRIAVMCEGAADDLPRLWEAMENTKHEDVRDQAILTLRNWIGRKTGQLTQLYEYLTKTKKYPVTQARTILQLLRGFDLADRKEPTLYQLLIDGLEYGPLPVRELAHWHLIRLAPDGQKIPYDATANEAARQQSAAEWRRLIPEGKLPPPPKDGPPKKGV
jgi:hypothetical protein